MAMADDPTEGPIPNWQTWKEFREWFWTGSQGNNLIHFLNKNPKPPDQRNYVRREKCRPIVYVIVINDATPGKGLHGMEWKLCKIGVTQVETTDREDNRMQDVMKKIDKKERWKGKSTILLILPISAVDTTPFFETERRIRENFGLHLKKDVANKLNLPVPTEWVLTTQGFIDKVKDRVTEMKKAKKPISTAFFKQEGYKFEQYLRKEHDVALGQLKEKGFLPQKVDIGRKERKEKEGKKEVIVVTEIKDAFSTLTPDLREVLPSPAGDAKTPDMDETAEKPKSVGTSGSGRTKASGKSGARTGAGAETGSSQETPKTSRGRGGGRGTGGGSSSKREVLQSPAGDAKTPDMDETAENPESDGTSGSGQTKTSGKSGARKGAGYETGSSQETPKTSKGKGGGGGGGGRGTGGGSSSKRGRGGRGTGGGES